MKIVAISDIHSQYKKFSAKNLPDGDCLVVAGDISSGAKTVVQRLMFFEYMDSLKGKYERVFSIYGNHDHGLNEKDIIDTRCDSLDDVPIVFQGVSFAGVNMSPCYNAPWMEKQWRNMTTDDAVERKAFNIPYCDILVSHCPPLGILDSCPSIDDPDILNNIGSVCLLEYLELKKPKIVICGHVHEHGGGSYAHNLTNIYNVAMSPRVIEI